MSYMNNFNNINSIGNTPISSVSVGGKGKSFFKSLHKIHKTKFGKQGVHAYKTYKGRLPESMRKYGKKLGHSYHKIPDYSSMKGEQMRYESEMEGQSSFKKYGVFIIGVLLICCCLYCLSYSLYMAFRRKEHFVNEDQKDQEDHEDHEDQEDQQEYDQYEYMEDTGAYPVEDNSEDDEYVEDEVASFY